MSDWFGYSLFRILSGLLGALPEPVARRVGTGSGKLAYKVAGRRRRLVERHLTRVVGDESEAKALAPEAFASYGRYWAELFWTSPRRHRIIVDSCTIENEHRLREAHDAGKGVILALAHMGNWEWAGAKSNAIGLPALGVAEGLSNKKIAHWFQSTRSKLGMETVLTGQGRRVAETLRKRLLQGGVVALIGDRDISGRGKAVEFFGEQTTLPQGPVALADATGAILLPVGCHFQEGMGNRFVVHPALEIPHIQDDEARIAAGMQAFATALEEVIRGAPHDWHMFVPNWPSDESRA